ncbi:hypothetical protein VNO78_03402 [Psophocarpus tetragonolobus]|uniref:Uncharacterized protein n=1 Tax=Psophocarpus tetragonolobus TaxID=3891 RepID=A0AAN9T0C5_PSOTE
MLTRRFETFQALALAVVSIGVAVATETHLQFHFFGACLALAWIVPSAVSCGIDSSSKRTGLLCHFFYLIYGFINRLMWKITPITSIFLAAMLPFDWNFHNSMVILASAIVGFLLQWSGALALGYARFPIVE